MSLEMQRLDTWATKAAAARMASLPTHTTCGEYLDACVLRQKYMQTNSDGKARRRVSISTKNFFQKEEA